MFDLHNERVVIAHINTRTEKHGDEGELGIDIKCQANQPNAILTKFSPTLKRCLYTKDDSAVEDMINPDHAPTLLNPQIGPIKWDLELPSCQFRIHHGEEEDADLVFWSVKVNKFQLTCQEGGTVIVDFRVQLSGPDEELTAKLLTMLGKTVKVTVFNEVGTGEDGDDDGDDQDLRQADLLSSDAGAVSDESAAAGDPLEGSDLAGGGASHGSDSDGGDDRLPDGLYSEEQYNAAVAFVRTQERITIRALRKEFTDLTNKQAKEMLEQMAEDSVCGPAAGNGVREVFTHEPA